MVRSFYHFISLVQFYLQFQLLTMSRLSPYRKQPNPYKKQHSPHTTHFQYSNPYAPSNRIHNIHQTPVDENKYRYHNQDTNIGYKLTQKKRNDNFNSIEFQTLLQKNRSLATQNAEIYDLLEQRGKIVNALEKKLEQQIYREVTTLQMIEKEKNKFIMETQRKFAQYECKIEELIRQIQILSQQKYSFEIAKVHEMEAIKDEFNKEQLIQMHTFANDQMAAHEVTQIENNKIRQMLNLKSNEIEQLNHQYRSSIDKFKNEVITLNNEILHINHLRKIELSQQKLTYDNMIDNIMKENAKQKELMQVEHDIVIKKLEQQISSKAIESSKMSELKKINEIEQNIRENQLLQKKGKLEEEIKQLEHFYRQKSKQQAHNRKEINKTEVEALSHGNQALVKNLRSEIEKLVKVNEAKSEEINSLYAQVENQRQNSNQQIKNLQQFIEELKKRMQQMERDHLLQEQQLKIRWAQLSQTNIVTLKQYYEHELEIISQQLLQKTTLADSNRQKLHFELKDKNQLKKRYDLQMLKASTRITELELQLSQMILAKREETSSLSTNVLLTSQKLLQQSKDREKLSQNNEQDKKRLHELILAQDQQIEELNHKIQLLKENYQNQIEQKDAQLEIVKKQKEDVQTQLKKEKLFYENELKKKEAILKENKEHYEVEYNRLKQHYRTQQNQMLHQFQSKISELQLELNHMRSVQKNLSNMIESMKEEQNTEINQKQYELANEKQRMSRQKKFNQERLNKAYQQEIARLKDQIEDLTKRLDYKNQDQNRMSEKYHLLQIKMQAVMESQENLRNLEEKILHLGQQNNLVKNIAEVVKIQIAQ